MNSAGDPAGIEALHAALDQWALFARDAELEAHRRHRVTGLELLHAARQIALGSQALRELGDEHRYHAGIVRAARAAAEATVERSARRLDSLRQLLTAGLRTLELIDHDDTHHPDRSAELHAIRTEADDIVNQGSAAIARLEAAHDATVAGAALAERSIAALEALDTRLTELRLRFEQLSHDAHAALERMRAAGASITDTVDLYEQAQLESIDARRESFPVPGGSPLPPPRSGWPAPEVSAS